MGIWNYFWIGWFILITFAVYRAWRKRQTNVSGPHYYPGSGPPDYEYLRAFHQRSEEEARRRSQQQQSMGYYLSPPPTFPLPPPVHLDPLVEPTIPLEGELSEVMTKQEVTRRDILNLTRSFERLNVILYAQQQQRLGETKTLNFVALVSVWVLASALYGAYYGTSQRFSIF